MEGLVIDPSTTLRTSACVPIGSGLRIAQVNFTHGDRISTRLMAVHERDDWVSDMIVWHGMWEIRGPSEFLGALFTGAAALAPSHKFGPRCLRAAPLLPSTSREGY